MRKILKIHLVSPFLFLGALEALVLFGSVYAGIFISAAGGSSGVHTFYGNLPAALVFVAVLMTTKYAVGLYHGQYVADFLQTLIRLMATFVIGFIVLSVIFYAIPSIALWRSAMAVSLPIGFLGLVLTRWVLRRFPLSAYLRRRILVIGSGDQAARIEAMEKDGKACRFSTVAFVNVTGEKPRVSRERSIGKVNSLSDLVAEKEIDEIVVTIQERRGHMPTKSLIDCRLAGTPISDYQTFCERETGRVDLDALRPDWFVFSEIGRAHV